MPKSGKPVVGMAVFKSNTSNPAVVGTLKSSGKAVVAIPKSAIVVAKLEKSGMAVVIGPKSPNVAAVAEKKEFIDSGQFNKILTETTKVRGFGRQEIEVSII